MSNMFGRLFDDGDLIRLHREENLTKEAPRQLPAEDRSPVEDLSELNISEVLTNRGLDRPGEQPDESQDEDQTKAAEILAGIITQLSKRK